MATRAQPPRSRSGSRPRHGTSCSRRCKSAVRWSRCSRPTSSGARFVLLSQMEPPRCWRSTSARSGRRLRPGERLRSPKSRSSSGTARRSLSTRWRWSSSTVGRSERSPPTRRAAVTRSSRALPTAGTRPSAQAMSSLPRTGLQRRRSVRSRMDACGTLRPMRQDSWPTPIPNGCIRCASAPAACARAWR